MKSSNKKILIVGGTGFLGHHLVNRFLKKKYLVTSLSLNSPRKTHFFKKAKYLKCDLNNFNKLNLVLKNQNFDYVINAGGYVDHSNQNKVFLTHFNGTKNLCKILLKKNIKRFVQIGSSVEYGFSQSPHQEDDPYKGKMHTTYIKGKLKSSKYIIDLWKKYNFPSLVFRIYLAYGPNQDTNRLIPAIIKNCLKDNNFPCSNGEQIRNFIYIDDVIDAIIFSLNSNKVLGQIYNLGSEKSVKVYTVIDTINKIIKKGKPEYGKIKLRSDESLKFYPSIKKIKKIIKNYPKINLKKGLIKTIKFYKK